MSEQQQQQKQESAQSTETLNLSESSVKTLLAKLKRIKAQKDQALGGLVQNMMDTQEELRQKSAPFDQEAEKIEAEIKDLMQHVQKTVKTENGAASYRRGSLRVSYDAKQLDAIVNKLVQEHIAPFRIETITASSVSVVVY